MISRAIRNDEEHLSANVKELLAIVWALKSLRNYLYGVKNLTIYTDHKPLTSAVSPKNTNDKLIRWKSFVDEHNATVVYTPGKQNQVADALSRQNLNALEDSGDSDLNCDWRITASSNQ